MRTLRIFLFCICMCISFIAYSQNPGSISDKKNIIFPYRDGIYTGMSQSEYTSEPYWGKVQVTIEKGAYSNVNFEIRDTSLHETFNLDYAKHFAGNEVYIQQTKNDWNGVKTYPRKFLREQDITKVDGISGATWSYKIFKASLLDALNNAGVR